MSDWKIKTIKKVNLSNTILIEGMPGIGNVGKIAADIIVEQIKAVKIMTLFSPCLPNSVFVKDDNMVELPKIEFYHKKKGKQDFLFLVGDVQPMKERDSYEFTQAVLDVAVKNKVKHIITLGGIGLHEIPKKPKVLCTGNDKKFIQEFKKLGADDKLFGVVGPIMGISGLLLGMSGEKGIKAVTLLAETYAHPMYIGLRGAKEIMKILEQRYKLGVNMKKLDKDIKQLENELRPLAQQQGMIDQPGSMARKDTSYIG
ncbi:MAG: PAC2 family protein [Nanoarchaeota archaeon]|nr:PAC2 family protein [Nanoarchaeota archaeon]MBU1322419.1 PAC2 family protein [Nanoarchaeota archaeon]MBU1598168.1 PAC2 family protein [Nanoarchaeota archaeon]MBU2441425.1 PAC2 family protein [Nanoarchaeota archaeon]